MSASAVLTLWSTSVGKKVVMAATGVVLVGFVTVHMAGNLKIFFGEASFNAYATFLRDMGAPLLMHEQALWTMRVVLLAAVILHLWAATELTQRSWAARPVGYRRKDDISSTYASRTMRWGGVIILLFVVYHILHFTLGTVGYAPGQFQPTSVYRNVVIGFSRWHISAFYIVAQLALGLHLYHGIWSMFQTFGLGARTNRTYRALAVVLSVLVVAGNISIPVAVLAGWVR
jgi:succinate dehydrogenase / fumarate reductase cytochrome b subunit